MGIDASPFQNGDSHFKTGIVNILDPHFNMGITILIWLLSDPHFKMGIPILKWGLKKFGSPF
jgi:hypothetical protein